MAMRDDNCFNFVAPFLDERGVWDNLLHPKLIITDTFLNRLQFSEKSAFVLRKIYTEYIYNECVLVYVSVCVCNWVSQKKMLSP
jgi:hypothetical protein